MTPLDPKTPAETKDYGIDWADWLDGATISTSVWTVPAGITNVSDDTDGTVTLVRLSGGTVAANYTLVNLITTSAGELLERAIQIRVRAAALVAGI